MTPTSPVQWPINSVSKVAMGGQSSQKLSAGRYYHMYITPQVKPWFTKSDSSF